MGKNSFQELEKLFIQERQVQMHEETKSKIESNIHTFSFISNLIELYVPKVVNVIQSLSAPSQKNTPK